MTGMEARQVLRIGDRVRVESDKWELLTGHVVFTSNKSLCVSDGENNHYRNWPGITVTLLEPVDVTATSHEARVDCCAAGCRTAWLMTGRPFNIAADYLSRSGWTVSCTGGWLCPEHSAEQAESAEETERQELRAMRERAERAERALENETRTREYWCRINSDNRDELTGMRKRAEEAEAKLAKAYHERSVAEGVAHTMRQERDEAWASIAEAQASLAAAQSALKRACDDLATMRIMAEEAEAEAKQRLLGMLREVRARVERLQVTSINRVYPSGERQGLAVACLAVGIPADEVREASGLDELPEVPDA